MLRSAIAAQLRHSTLPRSRSFVSTVLLTKAWENEPVNELRKEARKRGLPAGGNKATLITRLQQDDKKRTLSQEPVSTAPAPAPAPQTQVRHASTVGTPTEVPGVPSTAEPVFPKFSLDLKLPNVSEPEPEPPTPIPLVPDFWESSKVKKEAAPPQPETVPRPKVITVAGTATHPGGGPSHNLYSPSAASSVSAENADAPTSILGQLAADMAEDVGLPTSFKRAPSTESQYDVAQKTETSGGQDKTYSRTLDKDERVGVWILVGLFASSWLAAGYFAPTSEWAQKVEEKVQDVEEKATGKKH
ncbi:hypothetical protein PYCCODRAFT_1454053 [Trametes coccinea BRFM310]|uniref:SAP domain-containing protein n=1 Tax=Trametes coccinea (strain BRFM310) TaxID=1353009 RepID=A0A1Y2IGS2_TRAC3|nr:hypothetical protein PYCCODRAFT_1454053 [Trametes coccinea BRFM310]